MLTGLIPLHFADVLPFTMFTIADIKQNQFCGLQHKAYIWLSYSRNTSFNNSNHTLLSIRGLNHLNQIIQIIPFLFVIPEDKACLNPEVDFSRTSFPALFIKSICLSKRERHIFPGLLALCGYLPKRMTLWSAKARPVATRLTVWAFPAQNLNPSPSILFA
jgi:hypothetical protein